MITSGYHPYSPICYDNLIWSVCDWVLQHVGRIALLTQFYFWIAKWVWRWLIWPHYSDVIMGTMASQITSLAITYSSVYADADQRKHQSSASLAFVRGIHRDLVNSPHTGPVTRKMFPFDDVIMTNWIVQGLGCHRTFSIFPRQCLQIF